MPLIKIIDHKSPRTGVILQTQEDYFVVKWHYGETEDLPLNKFYFEHYKAPNGRGQRRYRKIESVQSS